MFKRITLAALLVCSVTVVGLVAAPASAQLARFDFEAPPLGTTYGPGDGHSPGDMILSQDGIDLTLENFISGMSMFFNGATIKGHPGPPTSEFPVAVNPTQVFSTNNINARFDFTNLGFPVTRAVIQYADGGGSENLDVNDIGIQDLGDLVSVAPIPGFSVNVSLNTIDFTDYGRVEVIADPGNTIESLTIGGQEFAIDNLEVIPEPAAATCLLLGCSLLIVRRRRRSFS